MHPTRPLQLLMLASVAHASWFNIHKEDPRDGLIKRQSGTSAAAETTTSAAAATTTTSAAAETTTTSAAAATTTTPADTKTTTTPAATPTVTPTTTTTTPVAPGEGTTLTTSTTSAAANQDTTTGETTTTPTTTAKPVTSTIQTVITTTNSDGVATSFTSESTVTSTPGLNQSESGDSSSGMSPQTRNTVIGVVVGVGGAIVLGALGFVAWRIWGKKKQAEENDGLMEYNNQYGNDAKVEAGAVGGTSPGAGRTPFQSTLESYHAPSQVNASSNF